MRNPLAISFFALLSAALSAHTFAGTYTFDVSVDARTDFYSITKYTGDDYEFFYEMRDTPLNALFSMDVIFDVYAGEGPYISDGVDFFQRQWDVDDFYFGPTPIDGALSSFAEMMSTGMALEGTYRHGGAGLYSSLQEKSFSFAGASDAIYFDNAGTDIVYVIYTKAIFFSETAQGGVESEPPDAKDFETWWLSDRAKDFSALENVFRIVCQKDEDGWCSYVRQTETWGAYYPGTALLRPAEVPVPGSLGLFGAGIVALGLFRRKTSLTGQLEA